MDEKRAELLKAIPSLTVLLNSEEGQSLCDEYGDGLVKLVVRMILDELRVSIIDGSVQQTPTLSELTSWVESEAIRFANPLGRKAINATGILLHTGLGRAPYCDDVFGHLAVFNGYSVLQTDLKTGKRSLREEKCEKMLIELTGCEAATVVNNNAAATLLVLNTLAENREAIVSRGQLVEIGGSFRLPDVMAKSGVTLHEVGTTNRTHVKDYLNAVNENTGAMIHVHTSNYRVRGFSGTPDIKQICDLRNQLAEDIRVIDDLGSGALIPLSNYGLQDEPLIKDSISAGADVVCFSGDKLISGPQCGIICGKRPFIDAIRKNPYARMFRIDKMTLAVLEETLLHFINGTYEQGIPFYRMLATPLDLLAARAEDLRQHLDGLTHVTCSIEDDFSFVGSGSLPDQGIPSKVVSVQLAGHSPNQLASRLRNHVPSVFCRIKEQTLRFDMRTLIGDEPAVLKTALTTVLKA